ncbi:MAG TPA: glycosyltransferase family 39 protein [Pseudonocardia sp.]|nr:glycosyltransferase family 39 protein [Pseudonocardia sp.]
MATALLYLWGLSASGWANGFYSAAAQAAGASGKAWFFGSSDAANWITVDKTPAALWVDGLAVRLFGLSSWSVLAPQAVMGVATVALLYASVRRTALAAGLVPRLATGAALFAGAALAVTPAAVLIFRFNNPDALLTLLLVAAAYATLRAVERGGTRWLLLAAALVGFGFLTKMLQAFLVLPALTAVWLLAAPVGWGRRLRDLAFAAVALVVSAGWWVLVVELWPAADRPYIGGSQDNSVLELVLGYNGFGRLTGDEVGSVGGSPGGGWGSTGLTRLFGSEFGGQAAWLLPAALLALGALLWWTRRAPRGDALRAAAVVWGGWLVVTGLTFSLMAGIIHPYYVVVLAPPIAALVGLGGALAWRDRAQLGVRLLLAAGVAVTAAWAFVLLRRTPSWQPWLAWTVPGLGVVAVVGLLVAARAPRVLGAAVLAVAVAAGLAGPTGYALATAATAHTGAIPSAGPSAGMGPGGFGRGGPGGHGAPPAWGGGGGASPGVAGGGVAGGGVAGGGAAGGVAAGAGPGAALAGVGGGLGRGGMGGVGGLLGSPTPSAQVVALLQFDGGDFTWAAAAVGSNTAAGYQLATQLPVMAVGGFNGTDPSPTLAQFQELVAARRIHWFVGGGAGSGRSQSGGSDDAARIAAWVQQSYTPTTVGGTTLYDLSGAAS